METRRREAGAAEAESRERGREARSGFGGEEGCPLSSGRQVLWRITT